MSENKPAGELKAALLSLRPFFNRAAGFSVVSSVLVLTPSWYMLEVYDRVVNSRSHMTLAMLTVLVLLAYGLLEVLEWVRGHIMLEASMTLDAKLSSRVFYAIFEANLQRVAGGTTQPMNDFRTVRDFLSSPALLALMESPVSLVCLVCLFAISPVLGWASLVAGVAQVLVGWLNERSTQPPLLAANRQAIAAQQYADGSLRNAQVIEAMGMLRDIHARWVRVQREFLGLQAVASASGGGFQAVSRFLQNVVSSLMLGLAAWLLLHNELHGGGAFLIVGSILGGRVLAPLVQAVAQWQAIVNVRDAYGRLDQLLTNVPVRVAGMPLPAPRGLLQVESLVGGAPGGRVNILKGVGFALRPGEVLAVVGPSASGKTTLARMLVGLWPAMNGKVRLDGADVFAWNKSELGPHIGYLPQGVELFDGTVAENIARFGPADREKVEAAARVVGLHEFISSLAQGYETQIGPEGARLSGGQRQRIGLARALYGAPAFVVLDEPNSSLDELGDRALAHAIATYKAMGTTLVVITHRTSVLGVADKLLVLNDGQAQMFGPRDDVLKALNESAAQQRQQAVTA